VIDIDNVTKRFGDFTVLNGISLHIATGEIFGLLGPNASGKTTLMRVICGILPASSGNVRINGKAVQDAKRDFGYVAQHFGQYEELTVLENITFYASLYDVADRSRVTTLLQRYGLAPFARRKAGTLSGGYQRRLALACALVHDPKVLFLDEPTAGIDPVTRKALWDDLYQLGAEGKSLLVTTHYMEEAQRCHRLAFVASGNLVAEGTPDNVVASLGDIRVYATQLPYHPGVQQRLRGEPDVVLINQFGSELRVIARPSLNPQRLEQLIRSETGRDCRLQPDRANLEDVFISLTQPAEPSE